MLTSIDDIKKVAECVLTGIQKHAPLSEERRYDITLVINELLVNSFEHAMPTVQSPVIFKAGVVGRQLRIGVADGGRGFVHESVIAKPDDVLFRERGRGLMLVRALCEEIRYNRCGNSVEVKMAL